MRWGLWLGCLLVAGPGCTNLPTIERGVCGNGVVEPAAREDCDGFGVGASTCRPPGDPAECRFDCSPGPDGTRPACPQGMGCGSDDVCRWASGAFTAASALDTAPHELVAADLDGDRRQDLVVADRGATQALYFDAAGTLERAVGTAASTTTGAYPVVGDLSGDGLPDVAISYGTGATIVQLGARDRTATTLAYSTLQIPSTVDQLYIVFTPVLPGKSGGVALGTVTGNPIGGLVYMDEDFQTQFLVATGYTPKDLAAPIIHGNVEDDPVESPCDELVIPVRGATAVYEYSPCRRDPVQGIVINKSAGSQHSVKLAGGATVAGPALLLDANQDGHLDIAVVATAAGKHNLQIAYGRGDGAFNSTSPVPATCDNAASVLASLGTSTPLAIGDLDGDHFPDYVDATGVFVHASGGWTRIAASDAPWSEAVIADLNGNGAPDVFAVRKSLAGGTFLNGTGTGKVAPFSVTTNGPLARLVVGDFDGDLVDDVAADETTAAGDTLVVMFGRPYSSPADAQEMGLLDPVVQIAAQATPYAVDNAIVLTHPDSGGTGVAAFPGEGDRQLRSGFLITGSEQDAGSVISFYAYEAVRTVVGDFTGDGQADLAQLAVKGVGGATQPDDLRLWLVPTQGAARIPLDRLRSTDVLPTDRDWASAMVASGDLDGDGVDELVVLVPLASGDGSSAYVVRSTPGSDGVRMPSLGSAVALAPRFAESELPDPAPGDPAGGRVRVVDLDADGHADVVALSADHGLVVFHGDGTPALGAPTPVPDTPDGAPVAFAPIQADRDAALELALVANGRVYVADVASDGAWHTSTRAVATLEGASLVAVGDFNGDGVDDLALGTPTSVAVLAGAPGLR